MQTKDHQRLFFFEIIDRIATQARMDTVAFEFAANHLSTNHSRPRKTVNIRLSCHYVYIKLCSSLRHKSVSCFECFLFAVLKEKIENMNRNKKDGKIATKKQQTKEKETARKQTKRTKKTETIPQDFDDDMNMIQQIGKRANGTQRHNIGSKSSATNATGIHIHGIKSLNIGSPIFLHDTSFLLHFQKRHQLKIAVRWIVLVQIQKC